MSTLRDILNKKDKSCKSVWFMRQAGRYLPEFRKIRSQNQNFIKLCLNSNLSSEITLQPIKRFNLDAAIIFSDILIIPHALDQKVTFIENYGPKLDEFNKEKFLDVSEEEFIKKLDPVYKAIEITRKNLDKSKSLIGFIGAPWTLLFYMFNFKKDTSGIKINKIEKYININLVLDKLNKFLCLHVKNQIDAGADVIQIFDSWAGLIPEKYINDFCYIPNAKIIEFCRKNKIMNICFPKGINKNYEKFNQIVKPNCINLDSEVDPLWAKNKLRNVAIQGGMSPKLLLEPEKEMLMAATKYIKIFNDFPYVFNLGHGLLPETDPDKVEKLIEFYRNF